MNCPPRTSQAWKDFVKKFDDPRHAELSWIRDGANMPHPDNARRLLGLPMERTDVYGPGRRAGTRISKGATDEQGQAAKLKAMQGLGLKSDQIHLMSTPEELEELKKEHPTGAAKLQGDGIGFAQDGKMHVYLPHIQVMEGDASPVDSVYHILAHETFHLGEDWVRQHAPDLHERLQDMRSRVSDAALDEIAARYKWAADWRTSPEQRAELASEWLARELRDAHEIPKEGLLGQFTQWLKDLWGRMFGTGKEPHLDDLKDLFNSMVAGMRRRNESSRGETRFALGSQTTAPTEEEYTTRRHDVHSYLRPRDKPPERKDWDDIRKAFDNHFVPGDDIRTAQRLFANAPEGSAHARLASLMQKAVDGEYKEAPELKVNRSPEYKAYRVYREAQGDIDVHGAPGVRQPHDRGHSNIMDALATAKGLHQLERFPQDLFTLKGREARDYAVKHPEAATMQFLKGTGVDLHDIILRSEYVRWPNWTGRWNMKVREPMFLTAEAAGTGPMSVSELFHIQDKYSGISVPMVAHFAETASRLGQPGIETTGGGRAGNMTGFKTWPRTGFGWDVDKRGAERWIRRLAGEPGMDDIVERLKSGDIKHSLQLFENKAFERWYSQNGRQRGMRFDTRMDSRSWLALARLSDKLMPWLQKNPNSPAAKSMSSFWNSEKPRDFLTTKSMDSVRTQPVLESSTGSLEKAAQKTKSEARFALPDEENEDSLRESGVPENLIAFNQVLSKKQDETHIVQQLKPMVGFARSWLGSRDGNALPVTSENTAKVRKMLGEWLANPSDFAATWRDNFRDSLEGTPLEDLHKGDAAASVLQLEMMDYARRLAAEGDPSLALKLWPMANDMVLGNYMTMATAARALQSRSAAVGEGSFWKSLKLEQAARDEHLDKALGKGGAERVKAIDVTPFPEDGGDQVAADPEGKEIDTELQADTPDAERRAEEYTHTSWWDRAKASLDAKTKGLVSDLENEMERIDRITQMLARSDAASTAPKGKLALSEAEISELGKMTPEQLREAMEASKVKVRKILESIEGAQKTGAEATIKPKTKAKLSALDKEAAAILRRVENLDKTKVQKGETQLKKLYTDQVKNPRSFEDFAADAEKLGVPHKTAQELFKAAVKEGGRKDTQKAIRDAQDLVKEQKGRRKAVEDADAVPTKEAQAIIDKIDEEHTEWLPKEPAKRSEVKTIEKLGLQDERVGQPNMTRDHFINEYKDRLEAAGVDDAVSRNLASRLYDENVRINASRETGARTRAVERGTLQSLMEAIRNAPLALQRDPAWRRQQMVEFFQRNGITKDRAEKAADWAARKTDDLFRQAQMKAAEKFNESLPPGKKLTLDDLKTAIRTGAIDPSKNLTSMYAERMGFKSLTQADYSKLADLDGKLAQAELPTDRAKILHDIGQVLEKIQAPKGWFKMLYQSYVNSVLSGLSTIGLHYTQPFFSQAVRLSTEIGDVMALARKAPAGEVTAALKQTLTNWLDSYRGYLDTVRVAAGKDVFSRKQIRNLDQMASLHRAMTDALDGIKSRAGGPAGLVRNLWRFTAASTDFSHRALLSGVEAGGRAMEDFLTRQEAMKALINKAGMKFKAPEGMTIGMIMENSKLAGDRLTQERIQALGENPKTTDLALARQAGKDETLRYMRDAVAAATGDPLDAESIRKYAEQEANYELGLRGREEGAKLDIFHFLTEFAVDAARISRDKNPLLGRLVTGFVSVPARLMDRSLAFTPYGLARAIAKTAELKRGDNKLYLESMGSAQQLHQRMIEGVAGTTALAILVPLVYGQDKQDDPNYTGFRITLAGPKNKDLNDAWKKQGNRPGSIEWVQGGKVRAAINYARGGPESLKTALISLGTIDDMRLNGTLKNPDVIENVGQYLKDGLSGGLKEASFFGLKNLASLPSMTGASEKSAASNIAYMTSGAVPWSGLVRSLAKLATGPVDQSSVRSALIAQTPFVSFAGQPALNFLGDPIGEAPSDPFTTASDRLSYAGLPLYLGISPTSPNAALYDLMLRQGKTPTAPSRSALARKNGLVTDTIWSRFVKTRGKLIKDAMQSDLPALQAMGSKDFEKAISRIDAEAQSGAEEQLNLR